ncbi:hypothetical protein CR513_21915, partial [Mucuna pruriens]
MKSIKEGRVDARMKVNLAKESNMRADKLTETISAIEDQTQTEEKLDVPPGSKSEVAQEVNAELNPKRTETILSSRLKQHRAEIMSALMMPSREPDDQTDPRPTIEHKEAIGWKLSDLLGINPSICMHRILMEEDIKPVRQQQRRLNPTILDVSHKATCCRHHLYHLR